MVKLGLIVKQRVAYKVTTLRKHCHLVADNLLNRQFNTEKQTKFGLVTLDIPTLQIIIVLMIALTAKSTMSDFKYSMNIALI